jgi:integrase
MTRDTESEKRRPYQLADGRYRVKATVRTVDGHQTQRAFYGATLAEAKRKRSDWQRDEAARAVEPTRITVAQYLDRWYASVEAPLKPATRHRYRYEIEHYIKPALGPQPLQKLTAGDLEEFITGLHRNDAGELRLRTASRVRLRLLSALERAVKLGLIPRNPMRAVEPVKVPQREIEYWQPEDLRRFLTATRGRRWYPMYVVAVGTGLRRGELLALKWADVSASSLTVRGSNVEAGGKRSLGTPKTRAGQRRVPFGSSVAAAFQEVADRDGRDGERFVFGLHDGRMIHPTNFSRYWRTDVKRSGVPYMHFHVARHR